MEQQQPLIEYDYLIRLNIISDTSGTGRLSLVSRYIDDKFTENTIQIRIGIDLRFKNQIQIGEDNVVKAQIWQNSNIDREFEASMLRAIFQKA
jgi:hypothetical protein